MFRDTDVMIRPLRQKNLSKAFYSQLEEVHQKMAEAALRGRYVIYKNKKYLKLSPTLTNLHLHDSS